MNERTTTTTRVGSSYSSFIIPHSAFVLLWLAGIFATAHAEELSDGLAWVEYHSSDFTRPAGHGVDEQLLHERGTQTGDYARLWLGYLRAPTTGRLTLHAEADDGLRVLVADQAVLHQVRPEQETRGQIEVTADEWLPVSVEFVQRGGTAHVRLFWSWEGSPKTLVPADAFRTSASATGLVEELFAGKLAAAEAVRRLHASGPISAKPAGPPVDFAREIRPLLAARCFGCHGAEKQEAGLRLDIRAAALAGGDNGPVLFARRAQRSPLVARITSHEESERMPPEGEPLKESDVALLRRWIEQALPWPDELAGSLSGSDHWAFRPVLRPELPTVQKAGWVRNPIDTFVLARLEAEGIAPAPEAPRAVLIRRLSLDLVGLPPTPTEVEAFERDADPQAYDRLVETLLESRHFGERWGRHWLDLARYADSDGYENDKPRLDAWRYRDWVIDAFNRDLPFDQFTIEQLAGDLLPNPSPEQLQATGFHRHTLHNSAGGADREEFRVKAVKDRANVTAGVWLGLTALCAQCHSHKYDPVSQREYYGLYAFFNNADERNINIAGGEVLAFAELREPRPTHVHLRGDFLRPGPAVDPHTPAVLPPLVVRGKRPDRLDLARWLVSSDQPLTPRVEANRTWQTLFGAALVTTPEDFGLRGQPPTHPELLDWLAAELVSQGWSRKQLIRTIVRSNTYRQSSVHRPELAERDPSNSLLARQNRVRVEAEIVRDLALAASGLLNPKIGGSSFQPPLPKGLASAGELKNERFMEASSAADRYRRGTYINVQRTYPFPMLAAFDAPDGNQTCARRDRTTTPLQALTLLNDPVFVECAAAFGRRLATAAGDDGARLESAWRGSLARAPEEPELAVLLKLLAESRQLYSADAQAAAQVCGGSAAPGKSVAETASWIAVARTLLNLDEFSTRD